MKFDVFRLFCHDQNTCLHVTSLCLRTYTVNIPQTLVMEIPTIQDFWADRVQESKIKILSPQNLAKDCLSDAVKIYQ